MKHSFTLILVCTLFLSSFTVFYPVDICIAAGDTLHVGSGQTYTNIQDAINAANDSDTIYVHSGTYNENIVVDKTLDVMGYGSGTKVISGADTNKNTIRVEAGNVYISGFTVQNTVGSAYHYSCIFATSVSGGTITDNTIKDGENGIYLVSSSGITISDNTIKDNDQSGIIITSSSSNIINGNTIQTNGNGIYLSSSNSNEVYQNTITSNGYGVKTFGSNNNIFYKNDFSESGVNEEEIVLNAWDPGSNTWYKNSEGNYWDDYGGVDNDPPIGVGDTPYNIPGGGGNQDLYPLGYFVNPQPVAYIDSITPNPATVGQTVTFDGRGTDDGKIEEWEWRANGDLISIQEDFSDSSFSAGTYTIRFRVKDDDGDWSEYKESPSPLTIVPSGNGDQNQPPTASIDTLSPSEAEYGSPIHFKGTGQDTDGYITEYYWSSNLPPDGYLSDSPEFYKDDLSVGTHTISFKVKDNDNAWSNTKTGTVVITSVEPDDNNPPVADAGGSYSGIANLSITFDGSDSYDSDSDDTISSYSWNFGDGDTGTGMTATHIYTLEGSYTVELTVTDSYGAQSTTTATVTVVKASNGGNGGNGDNDGSNDDLLEIPGFEILLAIVITIILIIIGMFIKSRR